MDLEIKEGIQEYLGSEERFARLVQATGSVQAAREEIAHRRRVARAKARATAIGLAYWPALVWGPRVDPRAFLVAERVLGKGLPAWGEEMLGGGRSHGPWDSHGHHGISPQGVAWCWFRAGCRDSKKFRRLLKAMAGDLSVSQVRKSWSPRQTADYIRGRRWVERHFPLVRFGGPTVVALGRLSWHCRWAAMAGIEDLQDRVLRTRDLNWAAVKVAQKGLRFAVPFMPRKVAMKAAWYPILGDRVRVREVCLLGVFPWEIKTRALEGLVPQDAGFEQVVPAVRLVRLFGADAAAIRRWADRFGGSLHDAGQFRLPDGPIAPEWGRLVLRAPSVARHLASLREVEAIVGHAPATAEEFFSVLQKIPVAGDWWVMEANLSRGEEAEYRSLFQEGGKVAEMVPAPIGVVDGGYELRQLAHDDPRQVTAGVLTGCCQHLGGAAASCARAAWQQPGAAVWAVFKGRRMVAQAFVWRSADDQLVLDSVECLGGHGEAVAPLFVEAARRAVGRLGVRRVLVGNTGFGATRQVIGLQPDRKVESTPGCIFGLGYSDANGVVAVAESDDHHYVPGSAVTGSMASAVGLVAEAGLVAHNEFLEGSGVFCEHCEAEVHPQAEICPACGWDISEWVGEGDEVGA